jgi:hypothetical protein
MVDGADIGWVDGLGNEAADSAIVVHKGGGLIRIGVHQVNDVFNTGCCRVHIENPTPIKVVGLGTWGFELLNCVCELESWLAG